MKENKTVNISVREEYEPVWMEVVGTSLQDVLCGSNGIKDMYVDEDAGWSFLAG